MLCTGGYKHVDGGYLSNILLYLHLALLPGITVQILIESVVKRSQTANTKQNISVSFGPLRYRCFVKHVWLTLTGVKFKSPMDPHAWNTITTHLK